jgi:Protein of unknown function (DUF3616)
VGSRRFESLPMPNTRLAHAVRLEFRADSLTSRDLSGAALTGDCLWVAGDEACGLCRLQALPPSGGEVRRYGQALDVPLSGLLDLPGADDDEADLEGLAVADDWLWLVGSHGLKRKNTKPGREPADNAKRLAKLSLDGNRRLLARLPLEPGDDGLPRVVRQARDGRQAARLKGDARSNQLTDALADDPHLGPFLAIPGKDNGLDIEGLAVLGPRLLLGLRGPVLRGWTGLLEIEVEARGEQLRLVPLDNTGRLYRKHFLQLEGLGVRDLHFQGDDLCLLAGPTMVLNGDIRLFKWPGARPWLAANTAPVSFHEGLTESIRLPHGRGTDRAEALCELPPLAPGEPGHWLVLYDAPGAERHPDPLTVYGDLLLRR